MKTFTLRHLFEAKDRQHIYDILIDFRRFGEIHPLMKEVTVIGNPSPGVTTYFVKEEVVMGGWLKMKPKYKVHGSEPDPSKTILYTSRINGFLNLRITFSFSEPDANGHIELMEQVEVTRLPLITSLFWNVFKQAHSDIFGKLAQALKDTKSQTIPS